ncbi:hypothetical protein RhiirA1_458664 [Rhizophagus irregularis]|uniref:Uncharacterized protein n=1 Tax=Rhizophagus irregularis TaxID=588596 RepID=A0A2I1FJV9_9GLOM|nr:hypothetical protein RhiirA1_458664 [Rhizophagus irregularis]PKY34660.1 hypothetical protein RhiirB3_454598 [Rhizophagus irregularis]CAB5383238.1 unnamed protein product [Rhizophagus irregularis]
MYDEFCKIHSTITQHGGQKETWNQISSKWGYCRQDLVSQCNVCAARLTRIRPLAGIPIIEQKFMSRLQGCTKNQSSSTGMLTGSMCKCKSNCNTNKCHCKQSGARCGSKCHSGKSCNIKTQN